MPTALTAISPEFLITSCAKETLSLQTFYESSKGFCRGQTQRAFHWESVLKCLYNSLSICHEIISALQFSLQFFRPHLVFVFFLKEPLYSEWEVRSNDYKSTQWLLRTEFYIENRKGCQVHQQRSGSHESASFMRKRFALKRENTTIQIN